MTEQEINIVYRGICKNLTERKLKPAFDLLGKFIQSSGYSTVMDEYQNLEETYKLMLKYTVEGIKDPERQKIYRKLVLSVFELSDKVFEYSRQKWSSSVEYEKKRSYREDLQSSLNERLIKLRKYFTLQDNDTSLSAKKQQKMRELFYFLWFSDKMALEDTTGWRDFINDSTLPPYVCSFLLSSLSLSLQRYFDVNKFNMLFDAYNVHDPEISQRALVSLLLAIYKYDGRMPFYSSLIDRLNILNENVKFKQDLERIILQIIRSKETEKLQQRIRDEILPEMIKLSPNLKNKINFDSLMEEGLGEDKNPDWQEILKDSPGLLNKMEEFSELQMKGADVFMGSFAMLKSFPFFSELSNWFLPFYIENPDIARALDFDSSENRPLMDSIAKAPILCNSDKYSFCFSIQMMPKETKNFMAHGMNAEMDQLKEIKDDEAMLNPASRLEAISNQYIQDLYRFYKLYPRKTDFEDIFSWRFDFHNKIALGGILKEDIKVLRNIAEYYFAKDQFHEAAEIFSYLLDQEKTGELYQKLAFSYQNQGDFKLALDNYLKAELFDINRLWNLKKVALCYRNLKQADKALEYFKEVEKMDPDSLSNQLNIGHCYLELNEFDEALKCYFKIEYLSPGNKKVLRPIAWCSFLTGKKDQAEKYLQRLMDDQPQKHDLMNMGHVQWSLGKRKEAIVFYQLSISKIGFSESEFLEVFEEDLPHLINQGVDQDDVPIMLDQLRYFIGKSEP
jgi:tetratricopeptide (TPR) repeat protein